MKVTVKYFGAVAEKTGVREEVLDLQETGTDIKGLMRYCYRKYPLGDEDGLLVAVNQELHRQEPLKDGDEVALLPPFAGG